MKHLLNILILLTLFATPSFASDSWDWQLSEPYDLGKDVAIIDLDPDNVFIQDIEELHARGVKTICYVSIGTLENYRDDVSDFPAHVIGKTYENWPDERFLDIREHQIIIPIMFKRFKLCQEMGFDAIEPDNMDVHDNDSGFDITKEDMISYILTLSDIAHNMDMEFAQKNVPELTKYLVHTLDFVITESCYGDNWCDKVSDYTEQGKDILNAEYVETGVDFGQACDYAKVNNINMILKDLDLTAFSKNCDDY